MNQIARLSFAVFMIAVLVPATSAVGDDYQPADGPLLTRFAEDVSPENALPEYPRPQMERNQWLNLNGLWDYAITPEDQASVEEYEGEILVPYAVESALSGVMRRVDKANRLWYRRTFDIPDDWTGERLLLHFGAVDWDSTVWVNGQEVGRHRGGYDPFTYDITNALVDQDEQEIIVSVWDPSSEGTQPRGKQVVNPHGIWYTPVTGIWQTVWIEPVPETSIAKLKGVPDIDEGVLELTVRTSGAQEGDIVTVQAYDGERSLGPFAEGQVGQPVNIKIDNPQLWSPDDPFLYRMTVSIVRDGETVDSVESYFGMREVSLGKDESGITRMMLNGEFVFQIGPLDQGWWPDGLYTPATNEALVYDLQTLKNVGYNMLREHVKVAPERLYYYCDLMGLLVWQDMPNGGNPYRGEGENRTKDEEVAAQFRTELQALIDTHDNHPCIIVWVPFNEGWGQHDTEEVVDWIKEYDPSRLVINASGWTDMNCGDILDIHRYPGPGAPEPEEDRAIVLGEFGGLGLPLTGHTWQEEENWGYRSYEDQESLTAAYVDLIRKLHPLVGKGLSAAVYTQTSDVEVEVNGLMTYDRDVMKLDVEQLAAAHARLYLPPPIIKPIVPTSQTDPQTWRYTFDDPGKSWMEPENSVDDWEEGPGGFGTEMTPGTVVRTTWNGSNIWMRRTFTLDELPTGGTLALTMHHDEDAVIYINGEQVLAVEGYTTGYTEFQLSKDAIAALKEGENVLAVECLQTMGGQYIDVGLSLEIQPEE
jgi:hypothetical protein